jgi:hypothetical protein
VNAGLSFALFAPWREISYVCEKISRKVAKNAKNEDQGGI